MKTTKRFFIAALAVLGFSMTACNTIEGIGKDVEAAGEGVKDAARDANQ